MTWPCQVVHVVRKDLVRARWLIFGWTALVALFTLWIVAPAVRGGTPAVPGALILFFLGAGFAAWLIQQDGPHREGTFWPGLPLAPEAVLAGKVVVAFVVGVGIPLVGQLVTLLAFPVPAADLPWLLARSSVSMGAGIMLGLVLGSVTGSLRMAAGFLVGSFIAVAIFQGVMLYLFLPGEVAGDFAPTTIPWWGLVFGPLGAMSCAAFLLILYRRGKVDRVAQGLGIVLAYGCVLAALGGIAGDQVSALAAPGPGSPGDAVAKARATQVEVIGLQVGDTESMPEPSSSSWRGVRLDVRTVESEGPELGVRIRTWVEPTAFRLLNARGEVEVTRRASLSYDALAPLDSWVQPPISLPMTRPDGEGILAGTLQVEVEGFVVTRELRHLPPLALVPGERFTALGIRVTVREPQSSGSQSREEPGLRLRLERLADHHDPHPVRIDGSAPVPLAQLVEVRAPAPDAPPRSPGRASSGLGDHPRFLLAGVPRIDITMDYYRPRLTVGGSGTVSIGIWEHVRSEPVIFRVPAELVDPIIPGPRGPS